MDEGPDPDQICTRSDFGHVLAEQREYAGLSVRQLAARSGIPASTIGGYLSGHHLPSAGQVAQFRGLLAACGVIGPKQTERWLAALRRARATSDARTAHGDSPYPGLQAYDTGDAGRFFGREQAVARMVVGLQRLVEARRGPLLVVVGASGSGKSSVLRAGLIPAVADGGLDAHPATWRLLTPGADPLAALDRATAPDGPAVGDATSWPRLLVVDQFEELFTLCPDERPRQEFLQRIAGRDPAETVVVIGLRADFYAAALREPLLVDALNDAQVVIGPMTGAELRAAITGPARQAGAAVDDGLVEVLLGELAAGSGPGPATEPGPDGGAHNPGALPLLSHVLLATWGRAQRNELTVADYRASGGLHGAVAQTAEAAYRSLDPVGRECARRLFCRLVTVGEYTGPARRRVGWAELDALADTYDPPADGAGPGVGEDTVRVAGGAVVRAVVDRFVAQRLLTADADAVQVSHEALLTAWPRLGEWLDADHEGLFLHRRLTYDANVWDGAGRDPGALLRGTRLASVAEWAADPGHAAALNRTERDFLAAALADREAEGARERRRTRRLRQLLATTAVLAVLAGGLAGYAWHARGVADAQRAVARQARDNALSREIALEVGKLRATRPALAGQLAVAGYRVAHTPQATAALLDASALPDATRLLGPAGAMQALAVNPAGTLLAATGSDGEVHLWTVPTAGAPTPVGTLRVQPPGEHARTLFAVAFSPDGRLLATAGAGKKVQLWDVREPDRPHRDAVLTGPGNTVYSLAFSPDGTTLAAGSADGLVHRWSVRTPTAPTALTPLTGADGYVQAIAFGPGGTSLAAGTAAGSVELWSLAGEAPTLAATEHLGADNRVLAVAMNPAGDQLAAGDQTGTVHRWSLADPTRPKPLPTLTGFATWVNTVTYSPDGAVLAAGDSDQTVRLWDARTGALTRVITAPNVVTALAFLPGGTRLAGATNEGTALLWPVADPVLTDPPTHVFAVTADTGGRLLAAGDSDDSVRLWRTGPAPPAPLATVHGPAAGPWVDGTAALSPDGRLLAAGSSTGPVLLWDLTDPAAPRPLATLTGPTSVDEYVTFSPDGHLLAAAGDDGAVHLWNVTDPSNPVALAPLRGLGGYVYDVAFSPDGSLLAAPTAADTVSLWDVRDPQHPRRDATIRGFANYAYAAAFTPDGQTLAVGSADKTVRLYDVADPARPRLIGTPLTGPTGYAYAVAIAPSGRLLATASFDGTVWIWNIADPARPRLVADLTAPGGSAVYTVAFAQHGRRLVAGTADGSVYRWEIDPATVAGQICRDSGAAITRAEWREYVPGARYAPPCH